MFGINERIINLLKSQKLSQKNMAESIGLATSTINNWLKLGISIPSEYIIPICEFLDVDCNYLLTGKHNTKQINLITEDDVQRLSLIHQLPKEAQYEFRGELKGYLKCFNEGSVAADEPLKKTGTTNSVK